MERLIKTKRCSTCKQVKPITEFHKDTSTKDNLCRYCKTCNKEIAKNKRNTQFKQYAKNNPEKFIRGNYNSGIYQLKSKVTGKIYVGKANNLEQRKTQHIKNLENRRHVSYKLRDHVEMYGLNDLIFSILEECSMRNLIKKEKEYIFKLKPEFNEDGVVKRKPRSIQSRTKQSIAKLKEYESTEHLKEFSKLMQIRSSAPNGRIFNTNQDRLNYHYKETSLKCVLKKLEEYKLKKKELEKWFLLNTPETLKQNKQENSIPQKGFFF